VVAEDVDRSRRFYAEVLGGEVMLDGQPSMVRLENSCVVINGNDDGAARTEDDPELLIRVADINAVYREWTRRGAEFLTPPTRRASSIRCYLRDPDGHLIEVGQFTGFHEEDAA
jgi:catechol 2,3-dioxygenase-like lactoylglutathione lyase family enzyme